MSEMRLSYLDMRAHSLYMPLENSLEALCITASALRSEGIKKPRWKPRFSFLATQINALRNVSNVTPQPATLPQAQRHLLNHLPPHAWTT